MSSCQVPLFHNPSSTYVEALLHDGVDEGFAFNVDDLWLTFASVVEARAAANSQAILPMEHAHWSWGKKVALTTGLLSYKTLAVEVAGRVQGMMLLVTDGYFSKSKDEAGKPLVYIAFVAVAPWNMAGFVTEPEYRGVGTVLMRAAVQISMDLEFKGRLALHSLIQSEGFYERCGCACFGPDADKEGLKYYELNAQAAVEFIE